jgi:thimet oligopeptidase
VLDGLFAITGDVFGLEYQPAELDTWHPDVRSYAVRDRASGELLAHFHMDLFPREGKYSHAAAFTLVPGRRLPEGSYQKPMSAIVANFTKPAADRPSLLQHSEVETLFHEFGHILHQVLTRAELVRFAGSSTETDFVEAPSQIMEHWTWRPEVLATFARHYETGEPIPESLVKAMVEARNLNVALTTLRQVQFGVFDMGIHGEGAADADLDEIHRRATEVSLLPLHEGTFFPASFGHMLGGYDAGYYGYLWSEVYGDDMFSRFEAEGVTSPEVGADYRRAILEAGGTRDGMDLLVDFLGREPSNEAFLRKLGIG